MLVSEAILISMGIVSYLLIGLVIICLIARYDSGFTGDDFRQLVIIFILSWPSILLLVTGIILLLPIIFISKRIKMPKMNLYSITSRYNYICDKIFDWITNDK